MIVGSIFCPHCGQQHDTVPFHQTRGGGDWFGYCPVTRRQIRLTLTAVPEADVLVQRKPGPKETK